MAIYLKNIKKPKSIRQLLGFLFNNTSGSIYGSTTNVVTYSDIECKTVQCVKGKFRSFDDILEICTTYFPNITVKKVVKELVTLRMKVKTKEGIVYQYPWLVVCGDIQKITIKYTKSGLSENNNFFLHTSASVLDIRMKKDSKYSWFELLNMLGLKEGTLKEFIEYYNKNYYTKTIRLK